MSLKVLLLENLDPFVQNLVDRIERDLSLNLMLLDDVSYIDEGHYASVYSIVGKDKVIRISTMTHAYMDDQIESIVGKKLKNVVHIFYHKVLSDGEQITVMEELEPLEDEIEMLIFNINLAYRDGIYWFLKHTDVSDEENIRESFMEQNDTYGEDDIEGLISDVLMHSEKLEEISSGMRQLENNGIQHTDLSSSNIMQDEDGTIKLIDIF